MRLARCMQGAPFILVGCRLMSHMHLLQHVCVCVRARVPRVTTSVCEKGDVRLCVCVNVWSLM